AGRAALAMSIQVADYGGRADMIEHHRRRAHNRLAIVREDAPAAGALNLGSDTMTVGDVAAILRPASSAPEAFERIFGLGATLSLRLVDATAEIRGLIESATGRPLSEGREAPCDGTEALRDDEVAAGNEVCILTRRDAIFPSEWPGIEAKTVAGCIRNDALCVAIASAISHGLADSIGWAGREAFGRITISEDHRYYRSERLNATRLAFEAAAAAMA
ncbi:hypothetical protein, partial [Falsiroseomonas sp. CW058]|uniref:hypothetical protein n=1 Tax=Falsiroseomonas sp. CW058 TaxID=3388664 RepID=UPI003D323251